jgi:uncharacterized membrane protein
MVAQMNEVDAATRIADTRDGSDSTGFHSAMVHLYRGEMNRMTVWRQRLDVTSNWAILLTMGLTTFTLGSREVPHYTLLLGLALIAISILIEARRYRHLHHSKWRLWLMEIGYFREFLIPSEKTSFQWHRVLAQDLKRSRLLVTWLSAARVRLRRNYLLLLYFITAVWVTKLYIHPHSPHTSDEFVARLAVGDMIPSWFVAVTAPLFVVGATALAATCPSGEELEDWSEELAKDDRATV